MASDTTHYMLESSPFTTYQLSVAAVNSAGVGRYSDILELRTMEAGKIIDIVYFGELQSVIVF